MSEFQREGGEGHSRKASTRHYMLTKEILRAHWTQCATRWRGRPEPYERMHCQARRCFEYESGGSWARDVARCCLTRLRGTALHAGPGWRYIVSSKTWPVFLPVDLENSRWSIECTAIANAPPTPRNTLVFANKPGAAETALHTRAALRGKQKKRKRILSHTRKFVTTVAKFSTIARGRGG